MEARSGDYQLRCERSNRVCNGEHVSLPVMLGLHSISVVSTVWEWDKHQPPFISPAELCGRRKRLCNQFLKPYVGEGEYWRSNTPLYIHGL
ncbi:Taurine hydroxylase-like protein SAT17 [Clarias magur]|uniref:Taurine hydroxylase-like protein SAT17 n=1 Tax=Clarias magur TaxID=1594786 RepID=A0A8J4TZJ2_CLAMG|nr:Taurine hydroxylase-like protein SAT17 [Clarias magur]